MVVVLVLAFVRYSKVANVCPTRVCFKVLKLRKSGSTNSQSDFNAAVVDAESAVLVVVVLNEDEGSDVVVDVVVTGVVVVVEKIGNGVGVLGREMSIKIKIAKMRMVVTQ